MRRRDGIETTRGREQSKRNWMVLTDDHSPNAGVVEYPSCGYVCDTHAAVTVPDGAQDRQQLLEQWPVSPRLQDHV